MTRMRFCKLLMGAGLSRNEVQRLAEMRPRHCSYFGLFMVPDIWLFWRMSKYDAETVLQAPDGARDLPE